MTDSAQPMSPDPASEIDQWLESGTLPEALHVRLSHEALAEAERLAATEYGDQPLRVYIEGKGCDGFYYGVAFDETTPDDVCFPQGKIRVVVDRVSLRFLAGSTVSWVDDERGRGFLVDNPNHRRFRGKFFKRKSWQAILEKGRPETQ